MDQLEYIRTLQTFRTEGLDLFFRSLNFFDTTAFFFFLIPALWFGIDRKVGLRFFAIILLSSCAIEHLKNLFGWPRPFDLDPSLGLIRVPGYGFPSGAATNAMLLAALFVTYAKTRLKWVIAGSYFLLVSFSRVYLGVHFPTDLIGGWVLGLLLWAVFVFVFPVVEKSLEKRSRISLFFLGQGVPFTLFLLNTSSPVAFIMQGINCSLFVCDAYGLLPRPSRTTLERAVRGAAGACLSFVFYLLVKRVPVPSFLLPFFTVPFLFGLILGIAGSYLCQKIELPQKRKRNLR